MAKRNHRFVNRVRRRIFIRGGEGRVRRPESTDALVLHEAGGVDHFGEVVGVGVDTDKLVRAELGEGADRRRIDDLDVLAKSFTQSDLSVVSSA